MTKIQKRKTRRLVVSPSRIPLEKNLAIEFSAKVYRSVVKGRKTGKVYRQGHVSIQSPLLYRWSGKRVIVSIRRARKEVTLVGTGILYPRIS